MPPVPCSGTITVDELRESLKRKGALIPEVELQRIMAMADVNGDGTIDYEEFMAATLYLGACGGRHLLTYLDTWRCCRSAWTCSAAAVLLQCCCSAWTCSAAAVPGLAVLLQCLDLSARILFCAVLKWPRLGCGRGTHALLLLWCDQMLCCGVTRCHAVV
jgi:hypothetical protein